MSCFTLICLWCGGTVGRSVYSHVITKFSRMGSLPHFLTHGAPLRVLRARELRCQYQHSKFKIQSTPIIRTSINANFFSFTFRVRVTGLLQYLLTLTVLVLIKMVFRRALVVQKNETLRSYTCTTGNNLQVSHSVSSLFCKSQKGTRTFSPKRCNWMGYFAQLHQAHTGLYVPQPRDPENDV